MRQPTISEAETIANHVRNEFLSDIEKALKEDDQKIKIKVNK